MSSTVSLTELQEKELIELLRLLINKNSLTIQEQKFVIELLRLIKNKNKKQNKRQNKKQNKQDILYVNPLQKMIAQQYDINLPSKSISNS